MTICRRPNFVPHHVHDGGERGRVAGVAGEHPDRDRAPGRVGEQPVLDLQFSLLAVPGVAAGGQRAAPALQPRGRQVEQRHPRRVRLRRQVAAGQLGLDRVLPVLQPVHRGVDVIGGRLRRRRGRRPGWYRPTRSGWTAWRPGWTTREMISARARSRWRPAGPSSAGRPSFSAMACTAATWPCGSDRVMVTASAAGTSCWPFSPASIRSMTWPGSADRLATVSFLTLPPSR